jgi:glycine betaine/proline transport system permease protein
MGLWQETLQTLVLVLISATICMGIGIPIGILATRHKLLHKILEPLLDFAQTIPTFVYLIPTLMLFGLGMVPGLVSTIIFAIAAPIRLTYLGVSSAPKPLLEAARAYGANPWQTLWKVELPHAIPQILLGLSQCIMLSLSMVVIAALVGAQGLGEPVVRALNTVNLRLGFEAGLAIVILAMILDRTLQQSQRSSS